MFTLYRVEFISGNPTSPADTGSVCVVDKSLSRYPVVREQFECKDINVCVKEILSLNLVASGVASKMPHGKYGMNCVLL